MKYGGPDTTKPAVAQPTPGNISRSTSYKDRDGPGARKDGENKDSPTSSSTSLPKAGALQNPVTRELRGERPAPPPPSPAAQSLAKHGPAVAVSQATPRPKRDKKGKEENKDDIVKRLQAICTDADPTRLYRSLVKIGQG
jgi:p21-activated kinase 1